MRVAPLILAAAVLSGGATRTSAQQPDAALVARIDSLVKDYMTLKKAPSVSVAVVRGNDTVVMRGYGLASREANRQANTSTVYRIGSITKQFTSAAIMRLVESGQMSLDDEMTKYLPDVPTHGQKITIRQLLNHTSGIHSYTSSPEWQKKWGEDMTPRQIVAFVDKDTLDFAPGTKWLYNNSGYVLLGMILEKVTGKPYATLLQQNFFTPLGLTQTSYCPSRPTDPQFADGYSVDPSGTVKPAVYLSLTQPFSAGALCSTPRDIVKWQRALAAGRVVSARSFSLMTTPDTLNNGTRLSYGFGLAPGQLGGKRTIGHGGGINGFTTSSMFVPDESINVVVFTNSDGGPDPLALNIMRVMLNVPVVAMPKPLVAAPLADADRDRIPGTYNIGPLVIHVTLEDGRLMAQAEGPGQGKFPLVHVGNLRFGSPVDPTLFLTFINENGKVNKVQFTQRGSPPVEGMRRP